MSIFGRSGKFVSGAALLLLALSAGGCSMPMGDLPLADANAHTKDANGYIPVHDMPTDRAEPTMDAAQRAKLQAELLAARDRQASAAAASEAAAASQNPAAK
jgi:hypothetical protein